MTLTITLTLVWEYQPWYQQLLTMLATQLLSVELLSGTQFFKETSLQSSRSHQLFLNTGFILKTSHLDISIGNNVQMSTGYKAARWQTNLKGKLPPMCL